MLPQGWRIPGVGPPLDILGAITIDLEEYFSPKLNREDMVDGPRWTAAIAQDVNDVVTLIVILVAMNMNKYILMHKMTYSRT